MTDPQTDAVLAGSKGFAVALLAPFTERVGIRPRIATDAATALALCRQSGVVVVEVTGDATVTAIESVLKQRSDLRVVAAVPEGLAASEGKLRALGVELARWNGTVDAVLVALERLGMGKEAQASPAAAAPRPQAPPPASARPPSAPAQGPAVPQAQPAVRPAPAVPQPQPAVRPAPAVPQPQPGIRPAPAAPQPPPAVRPAPAVPQPPPGVRPAPVAPRLAPTAASAAPARVAPQPGQVLPARQPAVTPAAFPPRPGPAAPAASPPAAASAAPGPARPPVAPRPAAPPAKPPQVQTVPRQAIPSQPLPPQGVTGREEHRPHPAPKVAPAAPARPAPALTPPPAVSRTAAAAKAAPAPASAGAGAFFDDVSIEDPFAAAASSPKADPAPARSAAPPPAPAPRSGDALWPSGGPSKEEAESALSRALAGMYEASSPLRAITDLVLGSLSELERAVLSGEPLAIQPEPIRDAALMRVRVAAALASAPPPGSPVDAAELVAILGEIDGLLSQVNAAAQSAPPLLQAPLEAVRNALVKEAIDFSEVAQRIGQAVGTAGQAQAAARQTARAAQARVISVSTAEEPEKRRSLLGWVLLALAILGAVGYHGYRYWAKERAFAALPTLTGQPAGMMFVAGPPGAPQVLVPMSGARVDPAELERFKAAQRAKGLEVEELKDGALRIRTPRGGGSGRTP